MKDDRLLVAVDVDGTLINTEFEDVVRPAEQEAIRRVRDAGHVLTLCTGRNARSAASVVANAGGCLEGAAQILLNGALVIGEGDGRVLRSLSLPRPMLVELVTLFREAGVLPLVYGCDHDGSDGMVWHEAITPNDVLARYLSRRRDTVGAVEEVPDLLAVLPEQAQEVATIDVGGTCAELGRRVAERFGNDVWIVNTETLIERDRYRWLEVLPPHCNKGTGLQLLADELDVPRSRIVAIGDNYNDLDMFLAAGHSVAMGNAPEDVRAMADRVADPVADSGAARVLDEIAAGTWPLNPGD